MRFGGSIHPVGVQQRSVCVRLRFAGQPLERRPGVSGDARHPQPVQVADDNCSATAALMMGAPVFFELSNRGKLACDVWLVHLTGEEYPAEGLGTCRLCQWLVENSLVLTTRDGRRHPQAEVRVEGVYVLDMIAHDTKNGPGIFQISPGHAAESLDLARHAHLANLDWNASCPVWNQQAVRKSG